MSQGQRRIPPTPPHVPGLQWAIGVGGFCHQLHTVSCRPPTPRAARRRHTHKSTSPDRPPTARLQFESGGGGGPWPSAAHNTVALVRRASTPVRLLCLSCRLLRTCPAHTCRHEQDCACGTDSARSTIGRPHPQNTAPQDPQAPSGSSEGGRGAHTHAHTDGRAHVPTHPPTRTYTHSDARTAARRQQRRPRPFPLSTTQDTGRALWHGGPGPTSGVPSFAVLAHAALQMTCKRCRIQTTPTPRSPRQTPRPTPFNAPVRPPKADAAAPPSGRQALAPRVTATPCGSACHKTALQRTRRSSYSSDWGPCLHSDCVLRRAQGGATHSRTHRRPTQHTTFGAVM